VDRRRFEQPEINDGDDGSVWLTWTPIENESGSAEDEGGNGN